MTERALRRRAALPGSLGGWRAHLTALGLIAGAILLIFHRDAASMLSIWWNASTFGHCLFIPFIIAWLVRQRLPGLRELRPVAWALGLAWLALGSFVWLLGEAAGVAVFRHGALVLMLQGAVVTLLGPMVSRALLFPMFYAFFMVPVGEELVAPLQIVTARLAMIFLSIAQVPAHLDGIFITTPTGYFKVAEACSGAKFVIAMTAYGALVCNVCFASWRRRALFMSGALTLSVVANGLRAFGTIWMAHLTSIDAAVGFDHVIYGWIFFAIVMAAVMTAAWPFFDRRPGDALVDPERLKGPVRGVVSLSASCGLAIAMIIAAPLWLAVSVAAGTPLDGAPVLPAVQGWERSGEPSAYPWRPRFDGADYLVVGRYRKGDGPPVDLAIATFDRQEEGKELVGFAQGAANPDQHWVWSSPALAPADGLGEQITAPGPVVRHVVSFYRVGRGEFTGNAARIKLATMRARLLGQDQRAMALIVSAEDRAGAPADAAIAAFLRDVGDIRGLADRSVGYR